MNITSYVHPWFRGIRNARDRDRSGLVVWFAVRDTGVEELWPRGRSGMSEPRAPQADWDVHTVRTSCTLAQAGNAVRFVTVSGTFYNLLDDNERRGGVERSTWRQARDLATSA
jgi:hypothetical protein